MSLTQGLSGSGGGGGGGPVTLAPGSVAAGAYVSGSVLDGAIVTLGAIADAAVTGDANGTVNAHLRGLTKIAGDVWDSVGRRLKVDASGVTVPISAASLPLPTGAAQDRTTAAAPSSVELSDGAAFYVGAKTGQLPSALVGARLDVNLGAAPASITIGTMSALVAGSATIGAVTAPGAAALGLDSSLQSILTEVVDIEAQLPASLVGGRLDVNLGASGITLPISAASLPLPTNAATDRTTAAAPFSVELSDGGAFYTALKDATFTGRFPAAAAITDNTATPTVSAIQTFPMNYDGADWDFNRSILAVTGTTGAGIPSAGPALWDLVNTTNFVRQAGDGSGRAMVVGAAAAGAALAGNPLRIGISDTTNIQDWRQTTTSATPLAAVTGVPMVDCFMYSGGGLPAPMSAAQTQGDANNGQNILTTACYLYSGSGIDRQRNNVDVILLASAAHTTTQTSASITTYNCSSITVWMNTTVVGTSSNTLSVVEVDPASGATVTLLQSAAITTNVMTTLRIFPAATVTANVSANARIPRVIQIIVTAGNANSSTYSVGYDLQAG